MTIDIDGDLMSIAQAAEQLHGSNFNESDMRRLRFMVADGQIEFTRLWRNKIFIPRWQVDKLGKRLHSAKIRQFTVKSSHAPADT